MSVQVAFVIVALALAAVAEIRARGEDLDAWAIGFLCVALLIGAKV